jgi:hypothetical protein
MLGNGSTAIAAVRRLMQIFQRVGVAKNTLSDHSPLELSHVLFASIEAEVDAAFTDIVRQKPNLLIIAIDPFLLGQRDQVVGLSARYAVPTMYFLRNFGAHRA